MIVRTYSRRNRSSRSLSEGGSAFGDGVGSSGSQESVWSDPAPFSFPSSQESCWSQSDHGGKSRFHVGSSRFSQEEEFGSDVLSFSTKQQLARASRERPIVSDDVKRSKSKLKICQSDLPDTFLSGHNADTARGSERRRTNAFGKSNQEIRSGSLNGKRSTVWVDALSSLSTWGHSAPPTSTLMEAQESGEMMEHVDEANFALDGLKPEQPVRVQRASLTSLLTICGSMHQRRLLRTQGMAKPLVDAIVALPTDDGALCLAAAAVLYFLAIDSQDEDLLDSPACVRFLMKLLGTKSSEPVVKKGLSALGSRLASLAKSRTNANVSTDRGAAVVEKIRVLFKTLREHASGFSNSSEENGMLPGEEINAKWLALLTLEKACLSTVILEDNNAESVRKVGGQFKERLRELGGLDAICELAAGCLTNVTDAMKSRDGRCLKHSDIVDLEKSENSGGVGVLLRCLRVMENVTFLSEQNQKHLLNLKLPQGKITGGESFIGLAVNVINTLSDLYQVQKGRQGLTDTTIHTRTVDIDGNDTADDKFKGEKNNCTGKDSGVTFQKRRKPSGESSSSFPSSVDLKTNHLGEFPPHSSANDTRSGERTGRLVVSRKSSTSGKRSHTTETALKDAKLLMYADKVGESLHEDSQDPFAFDELEDILKADKKRKEPSFEDSQVPFELDDLDLDFAPQKGVRKKPRRTEATKEATMKHSKKILVSTAKVEIPMTITEKLVDQVEGSRQQDAIIEECVLSGVKVLMNLTNNNSVGCKQVAASGGLKALSSLLISYYPWPKVPSDASNNEKRSADEAENGLGKDADHDVDILVTVLGVLCNLVETDTSNRTRLASLRLEVPNCIAKTEEGQLWQEAGMVALLCSLFLTKQGAGEAAAEAENKRMLEMDEAATVKQGQAEAEDMIVEAYTALLLAFLAKESENSRTGIAQLLPEDGLQILVPVLERFVAFHLQLNMLAPETHAVVRDVIDSCKQPLANRSGS